ncbi:AraC family transcriptional regulator [Paenibacillus sp. SYP-B3998]|uniref:AraC family transcriptional regulator n=1 Tax=Paenibacillus sp. SYP-B3998 TaxID=2678564 RepID=A0A6G3ZTD6_9BACL|nr:AraC family transcriptional regulator [Paenibacillus sp. SYP-B3998]NEW05476.1 AraC family transcriptional regulator [Paenibacillus sp. SYP-B3998]
MMNTQQIAFLSDLLQNLQIHVLEAHLTQCTVSWKELDFTPEHNKLYWILDGEGWLKVENQEFKPLADQLCLLPAHALQSYATISDRPFLKYWCHFTAHIGSFDLFQWLDIPLCIPVSDASQMTAWFQELTALHHQPAFTSRLREKAVLLQILSSYLEAVPVEVLQRRANEMDRLSQLRQFIEVNLHKSISVEQMAKSVHLHPNYLIKYFKKHFGMPPAKYMQRKRIDKAKFLLTTTALSMKEIAEQTGYEDTNHFTKSFRKDTGFPPTEYRANVRS